MSGFFATVVSLSLSAVVIILILTLTKPLYRKKLPKAWQYYIWLIVIARLLIYNYEPESKGLRLSLPPDGAYGDTIKVLVEATPSDTGKMLRIYYREMSQKMLFR